MKYSTFPCADHFNEPLKAEIVCVNGLHDFLSFISIAQKETFHTSFVQPANLRKKYRFHIDERYNNRINGEDIQLPPIF